MGFRRGEIQTNSFLTNRGLTTPTFYNQININKMTFLEFAHEVVAIMNRKGMEVSLDTVLNNNEWKEDFDNDLTPLQSVDNVVNYF